MSVLQLDSTLSQTATGAAALLNHGYRLQIDLLESWLCRVAITPDNANFISNSWMIGPPDSTPPWQGRDRLETQGYSCPEVALSSDSQQLSSEQFCISVQSEPLAIRIDRKRIGTQSTMVQDRPMAAYRVLNLRGLVQHAQTRELDRLHLGLGDKAGDLDRTGKRFRVLQTDSLGYNAQTSDPLYKHVPWVIVGNNACGYCGVFYDTFAEANVDLGAEHSNYHAHYRHVEVFEKALIYYVVDGPKLADVTLRFQQLVGLPHFQPRWAMGFAHTSMHLADADNAQSAMLDFVRECGKRSVPLSALHSGSGYTTGEDGRRYVFTWNTKKFPDRDAFFKTLESAGLHSCANIKPVLLKEHPLFDQVADFGGFIKDARGEPAIEMFWGGPGASLDFTNPDTITWWKAGVTEHVLEAGFSSTWNDNNECEIWDESATVHGFGTPHQAMDIRPVHALLMLRASFEATLAHQPDKRPYTISRAGPVGIARYAQTWSGDNRTSWHTLKWNMANGLSMSLSGLPFVGHDIGGFDGPKPSAELLCRWVEMMCLHPRAVMNSWKPQETDPATLPWMHAEVEQPIIDVLNLRYRFLPWLYHLSWLSHTTGSSSIAPMMLYFDDEACVNEHTQFMVGDCVLVAPVIEPNATQRTLYLPKVSDGWYAYNANVGVDSDHGGDLGGDLKSSVAKHYAAEQTVTVDAPVGHLPVFVRAGAIIPIAKKWPTDSPHDATECAITVFVGQNDGISSGEIFWDDGSSWGYQQQRASLLQVDVEWSETAVHVKVCEQWTGEARPELCVDVIGLNDRTLSVVMP